MKSIISNSTTVVAICVIFLGMIGQLKAQVDFFDDFNSGASPLWGNEAGSWLAAGGVYTNDLGGYLDPAPYSGLPFILHDFVVDLDINDVNDGGVWLRSQHTPTMNFGVLLVTGGRGGVAAGQGRSLYWHIYDGGPDTAVILNEVPNLFVGGVSDVRLRVEVVGNTYSAFLNSAATPISSIATDLFPSGRFALYNNYLSDQSFDNVSLVPEPSAVAIASIGLCSVILAFVRGTGGDSHVRPFATR
jgi:hypothetical protein